MKLIKINTDHYIIVDDLEIKEGDWVYHCNSISIFQYDLDEIADSNYKKITHSTQSLEVIAWKGKTHLHMDEYHFNKIQKISLQEVKELIGEVDVEKSMWYERNLQNPYSSDSPSNTGFKKGFELGYNQALEDNKEKKYTEEDLRKTVWEAIKIALNEDFSEKKYNEIIQSLQPKTEWEVEIVDGKLKLK